jgi:hypothetical protein
MISIRLNLFNMSVVSAQGSFCEDISVAQLLLSHHQAYIVITYSKGRVSAYSEAE